MQHRVPHQVREESEMRVRCILKEICDRYHISPAQLHAETQIHPKSLKHLLADEDWSLPKENYERLVKFAFNHGVSSVFVVEYDPIWDTFKKTPTSIFRGDPAWDVEIERSLSRFIRNMGGKAKMVPATESAAAVKKAMRETNCIFVGSPKSNPATEIALCALYDATPFDDGRENRKELPLQIAGVAPRGNRHSAVLAPASRIHGHGFDITAGARQFISVHWLPPDQYEHWHDTGPDAAVVAIRRSPLKTEKAVTTILLMGYNGLATESAARQLTHGGPPLTAAQLAEPKTHLLSYEFVFKKWSFTGSGDPRRELADPPGKWSVLL
jgi:hypothetical protein